MEGLLWIYFVAVVGDQELAVHQINIGFDAAKTMVQRVKERSLMLIIIVRMDTEQRFDWWFGAPCGNDGEETKGSGYNQGEWCAGG